MRTARFISAAAVSAALATLGMLPLAVAPADAITLPIPKASLGDVHVGANIHKATGHLMMVGYVTPPEGPVIISRATHCNIRTAVCNFNKYKTTHFVKVDSEKGGRYEVKVEAPDHGSWFWQARVGPHKSRIWQTCKTATGGC